MNRDQLAMPDQTRRPAYHDYQPPRLYRTGVSLRRSYLTGAADSTEEGMMKRLLEQFDKDGKATAQG